MRKNSEVPDILQSSTWEFTIILEEEKQIYFTKQPSIPEFYNLSSYKCKYH